MSGKFYMTMMKLIIAYCRYILGRLRNVTFRRMDLVSASLFWQNDIKGKKVKQSRYRPGVAQRVPGS
jgi:hypothetical protein